MSYLIDTNVISELARSNPDTSVVQWFAQTPADALLVSVLTLGEIRKGVEKLNYPGDTQRKERLRLWLEHELPGWFGPRVLAVDAKVAERWAYLLAEAHRPVPAIDSLIAATAQHHGLRLVTRNTKDFEFPGLEVVNPWAKS